MSILVNAKMISLVLMAVLSLAVASSNSSNQDIFLGLMIREHDLKNSGGLLGMQAALREINERSDILSGYTLKFENVYSKVKCTYTIDTLYYNIITSLFLNTARLSATEQMHLMLFSI